MIGTSIQNFHITFLFEWAWSVIPWFKVYKI